MTFLQPLMRPPREGVLLRREDVPDALFATDNSLGIPLLDTRYQADFCELPVRTWGSVKRNQTMRGTWHFYTDDYRFDALWKDPTGVVNSRCVAAVEPNFTTSEQMPAVEAWHQIYRKRWLARYWQAQGIKIWVDLNVAPAFLRANLLGVPTDWRAFMTRGYTERCNDILKEYNAAVAHTGTPHLLFAVYGGGQAVQSLCARQGWIHVPETMDVAKGKYDFA